MTSRMRIAGVALALLTPGLCAARGQETPADPSANLAKALVERRAEVERLSGQLELEKGGLREELRSLALQKADLERQLQALELEQGELRHQEEQLATEVERRRAARRALAPLVQRQLEALGAAIQRGLPFQVGPRTAALRELSAELSAERLGADEALNRLWSALEDELRLTRENGLYRETIELEGQPQLVDVARLGLVLLYFRTLDGRYGVAAPAGAGQWSYRVLGDPQDRERVAALFEALGKHVRQGAFTLPNPYSAPAAEEAGQ